nr:DUF4880 domain-containing protein [Caulobacter soli]
MSDPTHDAEADRPTSQALAWLNRLLSGAMTTDEADAFKLWRGQSPAHEAAFADVVRLRRMVRRAVQVRDAAPAVPPRAGARRDRGAARGRVDPGRRALLIGGGAAAATAASYMVVVRSDLLTGGLAALTSDYSTGVGERRTAAVTPGVTMELNTRTSVAWLGRRSGVELKTGEALISSDRASDPFVVAAADGRTLVRRGQVNIRNQAGEVCVTCLAGEAEVQRGEARVLLAAGEQVRYADHQLRATEAVDTAVTSAWQKGLLIFRDTPLQNVVDELNRYRTGKIFLVGDSLARRPVYGVFRIDQIQGAIEQIRDLTGARLVDLPGGVVLLR